MSKIGVDFNAVYEDISKRSGLSVDICKQVMKAETDSVIYRLLKYGEASLPGRGLIEASISSKISLGYEKKKYLRAKAKVSSKISDTLSDYEGYCDIEDLTKDTKNSDDRDENILKTIPSLYY